LPRVSRSSTKPKRSFHRWCSRDLRRTSMLPRITRASIRSSTRRKARSSTSKTSTSPPETDQPGRFDASWTDVMTNLRTNQVVGEHQFSATIDAHSDPRGLGSNGTEKAVKPLRAYFVFASSLRLAAQARHVAKTYRETSDFCRSFANANDGGKRKTGSFRNNLASFAAIRTGNRA
jgi:hypothetical protein